MKDALRRRFGSYSRVALIALVLAGVAATGLAQRPRRHRPVSPRHGDAGAPQAGGLSAAQIRGIIAANILDVQRCYEEGLGRNPTLAGRVTIAFTIQIDGHVRGSSVVDDTLGDARVGSCIAGAVGRWVFPPPEPEGEVSVRFPFNLSQSGG